jgi:hypothetical protein
MPLYEVVEGATYPFGGRELQPGETIDLTEGQAAPWLDLLLKPVAEPKAKRAKAHTPDSEVSNVG